MRLTNDSMFDSVDEARGGDGRDGLSAEPHQHRDPLGDLGIRGQRLRQQLSLLAASRRQRAVVWDCKACWPHLFRVHNGALASA